MTTTFDYDLGSTSSCLGLHDRTAQTDFYNLKNKALGARRYGINTQVRIYTNSRGEQAYRGEFQTLLDGDPYQSSKYSAWFTTEAEAIAALEKTAAGALKRYAKLALDPKNKIEYRP